MRRWLIGLILLLVACGSLPAGQVVSELPGVRPMLWYQPGLMDTGMAADGMGMYLLVPDDGEVVEWVPRGNGGVGVFAGEREVVGQMTSARTARVLVLGEGDQFGRFNLGERRLDDVVGNGRYLVQLENGSLMRRGVEESFFNILAGQLGDVDKAIWSGSGERVVMVVEEGGRVELWVGDVADLGERVVMKAGEGRGREVIWADDEGEVAFTIVDEHDVAWAYRYDLERGELVAEVRLAYEGVRLRRYAGDEVLAVGFGNGGMDLYRWGDNGMVLLFETTGGIDDVQVSPDGKWVFFSEEKWQEAENVRLWQVPLGAGEMVLTEIVAPLSGIIEAKMAPDGTAWGVLIGPDNPERGVDQLWVVPVGGGEGVLVAPEGGGVTEMWAERDGEGVYVGYAGVSNFVWGADSEEIYVVAALAGACESEATISLDLVPHRDVEILCRFGFYRVGVDGRGWERVSTFETPLMARMRSRLLWMP
ncbi:MAG TPA: hypothetical protein VLL52_02200 [Anaerolineae bacterium]|nr:hypothetical protein [Anaerolineae bacterium]